MATISTLAVNLVANTSQFEAGMNRGRHNLLVFNKGVLNVSNSMQFLSRSLLQAAGITGLTYMMKQTAEQIDRTAKLSDQLGIATEELTAFRYAAALSGSSIEGADKGLEVFVRNLGKLRQGQNEGLKALGIGANQIEGKSTYQLIGLIADRMKELKSATDRNAVAFQLFGRQGQELTNMLKEGSSGLAKMRTEADRLGVLFNRMDAARVEEALDSVARLQWAVRGLAQTLVIEYSPAITAIATNLTNMDTATVKNITNAAKWAAEIGAVLWLTPKIIRAITGIVNAYKTLAQAEAVVGLLSGVHTAKTLAALALSVGAVIAIEKGFDKLTERADLLGTSFNDISSNVSAFNAEIIESDRRLEHYKKLIDDIKNKLETVGMSDFGKQWRELEQAGLPLKDEWNAFNMLVTLRQKQSEQDALDKKLENQKSLMEELAELSRQTQFRKETVGMPDWLLGPLELAAKIESAGFSPEKLLKLKSELADIIYTLKQLEANKAFDKKSQEMSEFAANLHEMVKTPLEKFKEVEKELQKYADAIQSINKKFRTGEHLTEFERMVARLVGTGQLSTALINRALTQYKKDILGTSSDKATSSFGTFSAYALDRIGGGRNVQAQILAELKKISRNTRDTADKEISQFN